MINWVDERFLFDEPCWWEGKHLEARIPGRERGEDRHSVLLFWVAAVIGREGIYLLTFYLLLLHFLIMVLLNALNFSLVFLTLQFF